MLRRYLATHGWRLAPDSLVVQAPRTAAERAIIEGRTGGPRNFEIYILSEGGLEDVEIVLPHDKVSVDYVHQLERAVRTLSDVEGRDPHQVITDVRLIGFDVVRSRIPDMMVREDTIQLLAAANYITKVKSLLAATATTEMQPTPYFQRVRPAATDYADRCRFGHTFRGSFGFTIESPIVPNVEPALLDIEQRVPFERRVIQRFAHAVSAVCQAVKNDDGAMLTGSVLLGFSANSLEQFAELVESTSAGGLTFSFSFSPEWRSPKDLSTPRELFVGPRHVEVSRAAAKALRKQAISRPETVIGRVERLQSEDDPSNFLSHGAREVEIQWLSEDLGRLPVRVSLPPSDYLAAIEAHKTGHPVKVTGTLEGKGRTWRLVEPRDFSVP
jgi:hypothetical protein